MTSRRRSSSLWGPGDFGGNISPTHWNLFNELKRPGVFSLVQTGVLWSVEGSQEVNMVEEGVVVRTEFHL